MDSDSVTMETDDEDSSLEEEEEEEEEGLEPKQEVWVQSGSDSKSYKPVHLNISYQVGSEDASSQSKKNKGNDPTALAVLRRLTPELQQGYRILVDLMGERSKSFAWPFMDRVDPVALKLPDYYDRIKTPMWLTRIEEKFEDVEYTSITEFVADVRQIFENCYRYNGLKHMVSRQAQMMECHFEQKLTQLSRHIRDKTHFHGNNDPQTAEQDTTMSSTFGRRVSQRILENRNTMSPVANFMEKQLEKEEEERRKQRIIERKAELERLNRRLVEWEKDELLKEPLGTQLKSMWEIPAIGQFFKLCRENMYLPEFSLFELERALVLPQSSQLVARIFTNVLTTRYNRKRVSKKPAMPYEFWQDKLRKKLDIWYAFLNVDSATRQSVARHLYIPERFFEVLGDMNPLTGRQYHDLSIYERVWILKGMCDHLFETDYDVWFGVDTSVVEDQRVVVLGEDDEKASYLYFPHLLSTDLRIYRQAQIKEEKPKKKKVEKAEKSPTKKSKTGTPSQANEGPKKRGRPRKNADPNDSSTDKTGTTPARAGKTPASEGPKKRGRPRKDAGTESEAETTGKTKETGEGTATPSQASAGTPSGRGRPRKDGSTPSQALKKTPAKPMAIITPTRRSSRRAAKLERSDVEEQDEEKEEKSHNGDGDTEGATDVVCDSQNLDANVEDKDQNSDRTVSADATQSSAVCDGSPGRTGNQDGTVSQETEEGIANFDDKHLETISADEEVDGIPGKTPAKPMAIITPTRRSSRRAAKLERSDVEEQDEEKEENSHNGDGDTEGATDVVCDSQNLDANVEDKDQNSDRTVSADATQSSAVCDGSPGRTGNQDGTVSQETEEGIANFDDKHLETISADDDVDGIPGKDEGRTSESGMAQEGSSPIEVKGESPSKHALCNGVMEVDEADGKDLMHSNDGVTHSKDDDNVLKILEVDQNKSEEEIINGNNVQASSEKVQNRGELEAHEDTNGLENIISSDDPSSLNQNQSNNVMDIDERVAQLSGNEVAGEDQCGNVIDTVDEVVGKDGMNDSNSIDIQDSGAKEDSKNQVDSTMESDRGSNNEHVSGQDGHASEGHTGKNSEETAQSDVPVEKGEALTEIEAELAPKEEAMDVEPVDKGEALTEIEAELALKEEVMDVEPVEKGEALPEIEAELAPKEEAVDVVHGDQAEGDMNQEVMGRISTPPPPQPLPGILPPEGEFELVCDSVESFRALIEKFAQKEETIVKGRKTIVQPIKRSGRTTELHKTLSKMLEDFEPIEAKLQKVVHKAREVLFYEFEAYEEDPSPNQEAAAFWYQLQVKKPAQVVESSSVDASSVDDDFSSSESSSDVDSDELSDSDSDGDETAEYDNSDGDGDYETSVAMDAVPGVDVNGAEGAENQGENQGVKVDLYSGVEIAGRTMRSSKRRRAQKREVIRDKKKAKRSKIQIVKGVPLQGRYAQHDDKETDETKLKKVHEELKQNLKAGSTFQMTKHIVPGEAQRSFQPYKKTGLQTSSSHSASAYQRDTSDKFIRILKRTAGTSEPATVSPVTKATKTSAYEPTLKVPFLKKTKTTSQAASEAPSADKKTKTETFSFTIDAKVWESLKDKPEERQRLIVEHVEKMRVASGQKKESPQKLQNSRQSPWFSNKSSSSGSSKSASSSEAMTDGSGLSPSALPEKRLCVSMENAIHGQTGTGVQEDMPILDLVGSQKGSLLQDTNMPTLAPAVSQKIVQSTIIGSPGSISVQQALTQTQGLQQPTSGNQSTAIASSGNSVSTTVPREQLFFLLPNGQLTRGDGTPVETSTLV
eukprot:XP_011669266.1 PREDICTED: uncharacterized protein LOC105440611 [Strongylocentrotus purpuratus]